MCALYIFIVAAIGLSVIYAVMGSVTAVTELVETIYGRSLFGTLIDQCWFCDKVWNSCVAELKSDPLNSDTLNFWIHCDTFLRAARQSSQTCDASYVDDNYVCIFIFI